MSGDIPPPPGRGAAEQALVLGGHSFIEQLGNDPPASPSAQASIVEACLDAGITWFDTTYQPERTALGRALKALGRRDEAVIIAWNFFTDFGPGQPVGGPEPYRPHHLAVLLEQLQTDRIDGLVVHPVEDPRQNRAQLELARAWQAAGRVRWLGTWHPGADAESAFGADNACQFMVRPLNLSTRDAGPAFAAAKRLGWQTLACSPFVRGWELDRLAANAARAGAATAEQARARLADHLLRYSLHHPDVDRLIVAMRRAEWVARNAASARAGPLSEEERAWLLRAMAP
jgi:aryl-alcohol dehydrogenase-like predicted oxidoreductase